MHQTQKSSHTCPYVCSNKNRKLFAFLNGIQFKINSSQFQGLEISTIFSSGKSPRNNNDSKKQKNLIWHVTLKKITPKCLREITDLPWKPQEGNMRYHSRWELRNRDCPNKSLHKDYITFSSYCGISAVSLENHRPSYLL